MKYTEEGNTVRLEMDRGDYNHLLLLLRIFAKHQRESAQEFWSIMQFCNRMNEGNPKFAPYEIPEEYQ